MWQELLLILVLVPASYGLVINEVMYNPNQCDDVNCEWLEIYNNDSFEINLTNWTIDGKHIGNFVARPNETFVVARKLINSSGNESFEIAWGDGSCVWGDSDRENYTAVNTSMSLANSNDTIVLSNLTATDMIFYFSQMGADGNGKTLCRLPDGNVTFSECSPTPGRKNAVMHHDEDNTTLNATVNTTTNSTANSTDNTCDISLEIDTLAVYNTSKIDYDLLLKNENCTDQNVTIGYYIEDLSGNVVKDSIDTNRTIKCINTVSRSWTTPDATSSETHVYVIKANLSYLSCNDTNETNNFASKTVIVKGLPAQQDSSIAIGDVNVGSDNEIKYGDAGEVVLVIYRGNTTKSSVDVYVRNAGAEKISETTNINVNTRFSNYSLSVPIRMKPNCDGAFEDGTHTLVVTGLDITETRPIVVRGVSTSACKTIVQTVGGSSGGSSSSSSSGISFSSTSSQQQTYSLEITDYSQSLHVGEEFETGVVVTNNFAQAKNFTIYSYVFTGNSPVSLGYSGERSKWMATYNANEQTIEVRGKSSATARMKNRIEDGTEPGDYNLRARLKYGNDTKDATKAVHVYANEAVPVNVTNASPAAPAPEAIKIQNTSTPKPPATTMATSRNSGTHANGNTTSQARATAVDIRRLVSPMPMVVRLIEKLIWR
jgi:hypothetical protein